MHRADISCTGNAEGEKNRGVIQAVQDLRRLREISAVVVRHGFGELWDRAKIWDVLGRREESKKPTAEQMRASTARRFRETLAELGPTFIKLVRSSQRGRTSCRPTS